MAKQPGQYGQNAIWDGPLSEVGRPLAEGSSRTGDNCMQILKASTPYRPGPISSLAKVNLGGSWPDSMVAERSINPTAK
tara:strand:- start:59 stop:295 length:237 start_codon:yes stop_codon:yes gene_type:complete